LLAGLAVFVDKQVDDSAAVEAELILKQPHSLLYLVFALLMRQGITYGPMKQSLTAIPILKKTKYMAPH